MGALVWTMVGLALWHFTIFLPDHFVGGIVGALVGAIVGAVFLGLLVNGFQVPTNDEISISDALPAFPGAALGIAAVYFEGMRREGAAAH